MEILKKEFDLVKQKTDKQHQTACTHYCTAMCACLHHEIAIKKRLLKIIKLLSDLNK